jgi:hypothetical protein
MLCRIKVGQFPTGNTCWKALDRHSCPPGRLFRKLSHPQPLTDHAAPSGKRNFRVYDCRGYAMLLGLRLKLRISTTSTSIFQVNWGNTRTWSEMMVCGRPLLHQLVFDTRIVSLLMRGLDFQRPTRQPPYIVPVVRTKWDVVILLQGVIIAMKWMTLYVRYEDTPYERGCLAALFLINAFSNIQAFVLLEEIGIFGGLLSFVCVPAIVKGL